jgi:hypothetical protein
MNVRDNSYCASDRAMFDLSKLTILDYLPIRAVNMCLFSLYPVQVGTLKRPE